MRKQTLGVSLALLACLSASGWAATIQVPADYGTIQAAIDAASPGDVIQVRPGSYYETASNRWVFGTNGPHQFGLFIDKALTIQGVKSDGSPVTSIAEIAAVITTNSTANFGPSGIFVQADGVSLEGLQIGDNIVGGVVSSNKTVEIVGDGFTMNRCKVSTSLDEGAVYMGMWDATHPIASYSLTNSVFENTLVSINNGVGTTGPVSGRQITGNLFTGVATPYLIGFRGWNGPNPVQGWIVSPVGGAIVTGNSFNNTGVVSYVIARGNSGGYDNSQLNWSDIWSANTFGNAAVALSSTSPMDVRSYTDAAGYTETRRIAPAIQTAIDVASPGDAVLVGPGTYLEMLSITKSLSLGGLPGLVASTIVMPPATLPAAADPLSNIVLVSGAGVSAEIYGLTIQGPGPTGCGSIGRGIYVRDGAYANIHDNRILDIRDNALPVSGCQNGNAIQVGRQFWSTTGTATISNNLIQDYQKTGIIVDNAGSSAVISGNIVDGVGTTGAIAQNGVQVSRGATATLSGNTISGNSFHIAGNTWDWGSRGMILYQSGAVTLAGGNLFTGNDTHITAYAGVTALSFGAETFGPNTAPDGYAYFMDHNEPFALDMSACTFDGLDPDTATLPQLFALQDKIWDGADDPAVGVARVKAGHLFVPEGSTIQTAINAASAGDVVNVEAGSYTEDLSIGTSLHLLGAGAATTTVSGPIGGAGSTVAIAANAVEVAGFTITRDGNNPTDWNGALNTAGVSIQGAFTGASLHDNLITGNRSGVDINNSSSHSLVDNVITNNRTGLICRNVTDNLVLTNNAITNNWTVGVVFLDASGGTNVPLQTALGWSATGNNISGNWYGQIVDRQTGGSLPLPGFNPKNFVGNYLGTASPVVVSTNSTEPGYAAQIPVVFGGTATAPGGQPDILGTASANILYSPVIASTCQVTHSVSPTLISVNDGGSYVDSATWSFAFDNTVVGAEGWRVMVLELAWDGSKVTPAAPNFLFSHADGVVTGYDLLDANTMEVSMAITGNTLGQMTDTNLFTLELDGIAEGFSTLQISDVRLYSVSNPPVMMGVSWDAALGVTVDGTAPVTVASYPGATCINNNFSVGLSVSDNYALETVEYRFDGGSWATVASGISGSSYTTPFTAPIGGLTEGDHSIEFRATDDVANVGGLSASWTFHVDRLAPVAATGLDAQPMHNGCTIFWSAGSQLDGYTLYFKQRAGYPYPTRSTAWDGNLATADGSLAVGAAATSYTFTTDNSFAARGIYDFILVSEDCVNADAVSGMASATNYFLGDAVDYDGIVFSADLGLMASVYGSTPSTDPGRELNVGPTTDGSSYGLPYGTTARVNFEDLIIFAINYGPAGPELPVTVDTAGELPVVSLEQESDGFALVLDGELKGFSARLETEAALMEATADVPVFFYRDGNAWLVDVVALQGNLSDGTRVSLRFAGEGTPVLASVDGRNARNQNQAVTALGLNTNLPTSYALEQNFPNPFNPTTTIRFALPEAAQVHLAVYNAMGQEVTTLVQGQREAGLHEVQLDGRGLASGVYVYRLVAGRFVDQKKLVLVK